LYQYLKVLLISIMYDISYIIEIYITNKTKSLTVYFTGLILTIGGDCVCTTDKECAKLLSPRFQRVESIHQGGFHHQTL